MEALETDMTLSAEQVSRPDISPALYSFFVQSFMHSQGDLGLQQRFFIWAKKLGLLDQFGKIPRIDAGTWRKTFKIPAFHPKQQPNSTDLSGSWSDFRSMANNEPAPFLKGSKGQKDFDNLRRKNKDELEYLILLGIMERDTKYQSEPRPNRENPTQDDSMSDPHASFLRRYTILHQPVGNSIFQELYNRLGEVAWKYQNATFPVYRFRERIRQVSVIRNLGLLAIRWETHHAGQSFLIKG